MFDVYYEMRVAVALHFG